MTYYNELGLSIYTDFISESEHMDLMDEIRSELDSSKQIKYIDRNKVLRYGDYAMCENNHQNINFPANIDKICEKLVTNNILNYKPDTININEYLKDDFIARHIDRKTSGPIITILSLKSNATMLFTSGKDKFEVELYPKMLIQMRGSIRWSWHHEIYPVKDTRYSIVFRNKNE
jgi:alkylated DNA repair dioxygenase AlkB